MSKTPIWARLLLRAAMLAPLVLLALWLPPSADGEPVVQRSDPGIVVRSSDVKAEPDAGSETLATVALGDRVEVTRLRGAWAGVSLPESGHGWIPAISVRLGGDRSRDNAVSGWLRRITGAVSGASTSEESASMGIRGLESADIANADPDPDALKKLDEFRATSAAAERYARDVRLSSRDVAYLDVNETAPEKRPPAPGADARH